MAACRGMDVAVFYPDRGAVNGSRYYEPLRAMCGACPVKSPCLEEALAEDRWEPDRDPGMASRPGRDGYGFRAGLTPTERRAERARRRAGREPATAPRHSAP